MIIHIRNSYQANTAVEYKMSESACPLVWKVISLDSQDNSASLGGPRDDRLALDSELLLTAVIRVSSNKMAS